jgi:TRAP-type C4-dicarboxylate transport system substrate-binding protein
VVQAVAFAPHAHMAFGTIESGDWWTTNLNPGTVNCPVVANTDALEGLSDENREILMGSIEGALDHYIDNYMNNTLERWGPALDERGIERVTYSEDEIASFEEAVAAPAAEDWIEQNAARGLPAQELYDFATGTLADLKGGM